MPTPRLDWFRITALGFSTTLVLAVTTCYAGRFDACAAITIFPAWTWLVPGLALATIGWRRRRACLTISAAWLVFLLAFAEEPWCLLRLATSQASSPGTPIRVVTLNCDVGNPEAVEEAAEHRPDILLLQESPGRDEVERLAKKLFGPDSGFVAGVDASMIVRGRVTPADLPPNLRAFFVHARVRLENGLELEVISTRLTPAVFRLDLWSPDCWREQSSNRRKRREQMQAIADRIAAIPETVPIVLGGDFNAPQGDAVFRLLRPRLRDSFAVAGRGWGNTIINDWPFLRIDQVWTSRTIQAVNVGARRTRNSDHRMVIADLVVGPGSKSD